MLAPACALLATVLVLPFVERDYKVLPWTAGVVVAGVILQAGLALARARGWCAFVGDGPHDFRELLVTDTPTAAAARPAAPAAPPPTSLTKGPP